MTKAKKKSKSKKKVNKKILKTSAWNEAEWRHIEIYTRTIMPLFDDKPTPDEVDRELEDILKKCPEYFPALIRRGGYQLSIGKVSLGEELLDRGFDYMKDILNEEEFKEVINQFLAKLEDLLRYDLVVKYLKRAIEIYPQNADFYEDLGLSMIKANIGDANDVIKNHEKALELAPGDSNFLNNYGWSLVLLRDFKKAEGYFKESLKVDPQNTYPQRNLDILKYMRGHKIKTFFDYLVRPVDLKNIRDLMDSDEESDYEKAEKMCKEYNSDRIIAFCEYYLKKGKFQPHQIVGLKNTFNVFIDFVESVVADSYFLYDDLNTITFHFKSIMHKFIFKFKDVDDGLLLDVYDSLKAFYKFLSELNLVEDMEYNDFVKEITCLKEELFHKMHEYNKIRHDPGLSDEEKEKIREELFEGDHSWPHLW
jgi:Tfp pilus assembly protein PilF